MTETDNAKPEEADVAEGKTSTTLIIALIGAIVAIVTGAIPLANSYFSEDIERCRIATEFWINFNKHDNYTTEEIATLKTTYTAAIQQHCLGG